MILLVNVTDTIVFPPTTCTYVIFENKLVSADQVNFMS